MYTFVTNVKRQDEESFPDLFFLALSCVFFLLNFGLNISLHSCMLLKQPTKIILVEPHIQSYQEECLWASFINAHMHTDIIPKGTQNGGNLTLHSTLYTRNATMAAYSSSTSINSPKRVPHFHTKRGF